MSTSAMGLNPVSLPASPVSLKTGSVAPSIPDEDDTLVELIRKVAKEMHLKEVDMFFLAHVLDISPSKWIPLIVPGNPESAQQLQAHVQIMQAEIRLGVAYGNTHGWSLDKPESDPSRELDRKYAHVILWARAFATGQVLTGYSSDMVLPKVPEVNFRQRFLAQYGTDSTSDVAAANEGGDGTVGAVAVVLLALGTLMYLTRR